METVNHKLSIIAYYFSKYDIQAVQELGYKNRSQAFEEISYLLGKENNYLKLKRDEFDVLTDSPRKGWRNRPVAKDVQVLFDELSAKSYYELTALVKNIITEAKTKDAKTILELEEDTKYISKVNKSLIAKQGKKSLVNEPKAISSKITNTSITSYKRDPNVALNALCNAEYKCECGADHYTFIRKTNKLPYTEPHHLVPMSAQKDFNVSLDVENNIVSLCSNCHNLVHYGENNETVLKNLFDQRKDLLHQAGIDISFEQLLEYYK